MEEFIQKISKNVRNEQKVNKIVKILRKLHKFRQISVKAKYKNFRNKFARVSPKILKNKLTQDS